MKLIKWIKKLFRKRKFDSQVIINIKCETSDAIKAIKKTEYAIITLTKAMDNFTSSTEDALHELNNFKESIKDYDNGKEKT